MRDNREVRVYCTKKYIAQTPFVLHLGQRLYIIQQLRVGEKMHTYPT